MTDASRAEAEFEHLTHNATELAELLPRLADALERDKTIGDGRGGPNPNPSPINPDVYDCLTRLQADIPTLDLDLRRTMDPKAQPRNPQTCIHHAPATWRRLSASTKPSLATVWARSVGDWLRAARTALGLTQPAKPAGIDCPYCEDTPLKLRGDEATVHPVEPGEAEAITWRHGDLIFCPECDGEWPAIHWPTLRRLIDYAQTQLEATA